MAKRIPKSQDGATALEYCLILALIGVAFLTAAGLVGSGLDGVFTSLPMPLN